MINHNLLNRFACAVFLTAWGINSFAADKDSIIIFSGSLIDTSVEQIPTEVSSDGILIFGGFAVIQTYKVDERYLGKYLSDTVSVRFETEFKNEPYEYFSRKALVVAVSNGNGDFATGFCDYCILPLVQTKDGALMTICDEHFTKRYPVFKIKDPEEYDTTKVRTIDAKRIADYIINEELFPAPNIPLLTNVRKERAKKHEYVDLGLSVLWATCNLGAQNEYETGSYFSWGEIHEKEYYTEVNYKWSYEEAGVMKYSKYVEYGGTLEMEDDAARFWWAANWRIPTINEFNELFENCTWIKLGDNMGYKGISKINGSSIVFPMTGYRSEKLVDKGMRSIFTGNYASSNGFDGIVEFFLLSENGAIGSFPSYIGMCIRPVCNR